MEPPPQLTSRRSGMATTHVWVARMTSNPSTAKNLCDSQKEPLFKLVSGKQVNKANMAKECSLLLNFGTVLPDVWSQVTLTRCNKFVFRMPSCIETVSMSLTAATDVRVVRDIPDTPRLRICRRCGKLAPYSNSLVLHECANVARPC